ncbi:HAD family hydrolase [Arenibacter sp. GZD96]|uniref:HAD family hydrolase n=1 Tax=Aurantibrevibacter litoralis TaxID=3106030 RepID=UPI002AFFBD04|nr:HAD family hydrolase [Arenibacter sp. GZD-96]MEA1787678.1 HAD family hydrolase [Arenibacter sp. GZD-96]
MDIKVDVHTVLVFDLDDTLYNELDFLKSAYRELAQLLEPNNWQRLFVGMFSQYRSKMDVFAVLAQTYGRSKEELVQHYRAHQPEIVPFPGVMETLVRIKERNGKIGILTDGRSVTQRNKLNALGLMDFLDHIVISEELGTEKPHENNYMAFEKLFGKGHYVYIADNCRKDFITPNRRGWQTIALADNGKNIHHDTHLYQHGDFAPQGYITEFSELRIC